MNRAERRQLRPVCHFDRLESRELMNAHLPKAHIAHVSELTPLPPREISGILTGSNPYYVNPANQSTGGDSYTAAGWTSWGQATITGTDLYTSTIISSTKYQDTYYAGNWTMTMNNGPTFQITYTGSGTSTNTGYFATFKGTAIGLSGAYSGKHFSFVAKEIGLAPQSPGMIQLKFNLGH